MIREDEKDRAMTRITVLLSAACLALALPATAIAQSSDPAWLDEMNFQLRAEKQCEVSYLIRVREGTLGEKPTYEARVQCIDGRMFDATRIGETEPFTFKACELQAC